MTNGPGSNEKENYNIWHKQILRILEYVYYFGISVCCIMSYHTPLWFNLKTTLNARPQTFVVRPVVYVDVPYAWCTS